MKANQKVACALLMNDIHVSKDNIPEFYKNWDEALSVAKQYEVDTIVIGGDLWQSRAAQTLSTLMAVRHAVLKTTEAGFKLVIANGNHDLVDQEAIFGYSHIFSHYPGVYVVDGVATLSFLDTLDLHIMGYFPEGGSFIERHQKLKESINPNTANVLYIHQGINGALSVSNDKDLSTKIFDGWDSVLVGHYHDRCKIKGTAIEYIGASRQHNYGEDVFKGYTILFSDGSNKFVQNEVNTRYMTIESTPDTLEADMKRTEEIVADGLTKVKMRVKCSSDEVATVNKDKITDAGASRIEFVSDTVITFSDNSGLESKWDKTGLKKEYSSFCQQKEYNNVETGLQYLDKIQ
jgi:DNA repair protein SbcD/Mre11